MASSGCPVAPGLAHGHSTLAFRMSASRTILLGAASRAGELLGSLKSLYHANDESGFSFPPSHCPSPTLTRSYEPGECHRPEQPLHILLIRSTARSPSNDAEQLARS